MGKTILNFEAIVFDLDGLLIDTESIALRAFEEASILAGVKLSRDVFNRCVGTNHKTIATIIKDAVPEVSKFEKFCFEWSRLYSDICDSGVPLMPGALPLLDHLEYNKVRMAIATSSAIQSATKKLKLAGIYDYFQCIVSGDQVTNGKPHPEPYLMAAEALGVPPAQCLALEDSTNGVLSAFHSGMTVVQIPNLILPDEELLKLGHTVLSSLDQVVDIDF